MKTKFLISLICIIFYACEKEQSNTQQAKLNLNTIQSDSTFILYVNANKELVNHLSTRKIDGYVSEKEFVQNYKLAVTENNAEAKEFISNLMGYDHLGFWENRITRVEALKKMNLKYNLSKVDASNFHESKKIATNAMEMIDCGEIYKNCLDNVTADYAMNQINCVAFGALGWTGVGATLFVACEAVANFKMYIGDKNCRINFKNCK